MTQTAIPFLFMRGGTSRGPYLRKEDLPEDRETLARVLAAIVGSGHPLNINGIGGGASVTTKVAVLSRSEDDWADVDYFFAQVDVEDGTVDFKPTCGNIMVGVAPAAIEMGLVGPTGNITDVKIRAVNTGARVVSSVRTRSGEVVYDGDTRIDGVPGTAAPIDMMFRDVVGGATGAMFPTGNRVDTVEGVEVSCVDVAMPMVIARASSFELTGYEDAQYFKDNALFYQRMETVRRAAGALMGMGDVSSSVTPKFGLLAAPRDGGTAAARYFTPFDLHPSLAVTGSQCISACLLCPGTVAEGIGELPQGNPARMYLEHPMGKLEVTVEYASDGGDFRVISAGLVRTARKLASGSVYIPTAVWSGY